MPSSRDRLSEALSEWRSAHPSQERLSEGCRARILKASRGTTLRDRLSPLRTLFLPLRGWALAGALPVALLAVALAYGLWPAGAPGNVADSAPMLRASRVNGEVVFEIANGGKPHQVVRTGRADDLTGGQPVAVTDGRFRDRLDSGGELVFYRID